MNLKMVTVVFAFRNRKSRVRRALESLRRSIRDDVQLIAVDGHSTDGAHLVVKEFDPDEYLLLKPSGVYEAWNHGLHHATTDRVIFLNSDDLLLPAMQHLLDSSKDSLAGVVTGRARYVWEHESSLGKEMTELSWRTKVDLVSLIRAPLPFNAAVYSRQALLYAGGFHTKMRFLADRHLIWKLLRDGQFIDFHPSVCAYSYGIGQDSLTLGKRQLPVASDLELWSKELSQPMRAVIHAYAKFQLVRAGTTKP